MRVAPEINLTPEEREMLMKLARSGLTSVRLAQRVQIVLLASTGMRNQDIAAKLNMGRVQAGRWRERYAESRLAGIERDLPRGAPGDADHANHTAANGPVEYTQHGPCAGCQPVEHLASLACAGTEAAFDRDLQGLA